VNREQFLAEFGSRTAAYVSGADLDTRPVAVSIGEGAHSPAGHLLVAALFNQLARAHSRLTVRGDLDRELLCRDPFGSRDLRTATIGLATSINPFIEVEEASGGAEDPLLRIAIGHQEPGGLEVGCEGWCAAFGPGSQIVDRGDSLWGAALAACITAACAFRRMCRLPFEPAGSYSLWSGGAAGEDQGPESPALEFGSVLQVGAGAVGAALDYWLHGFGTDFREWLILDGDHVDVSNLNRQLLYRAADAGFLPAPAVAKAQRSAELLGAKPKVEFWGEDRAVVEASYDTVLALADERNVRGALQGRQPPILLHATTSANWQAQSHRHIPELDDCIVCRLPATPAQLRCSDAEVGTERVEAALPFLSSSAGLLLAVDLVRLSEGVIAQESANSRSLIFDAAQPVTQALRYCCRPDCGTMLPEEVRAQIPGGRFAELDPARRVPLIGAS
jgi:hypothetical protein